jgi:hypothetical protein
VNSVTGCAGNSPGILIALHDSSNWFSTNAAVSMFPEMGRHFKFKQGELFA